MTEDKRKKQLNASHWISKPKIQCQCRCFPRISRLSIVKFHSNELCIVMKNVCWVAESNGFRLQQDKSLHLQHFNVIRQHADDKDKPRRRRHHVLRVPRIYVLIAVQSKRKRQTNALTTCSRHCIVQSSANRRPASTCCFFFPLSKFSVYSSRFIRSFSVFGFIYLFFFSLLIK